MKKFIFILAFCFLYCTDVCAKTENYIEVSKYGYDVYYRVYEDNTYDYYDIPTSSYVYVDGNYYYEAFHLNDVPIVHNILSELGFVSISSNRLGSLDLGWMTDGLSITDGFDDNNKSKFKVITTRSGSTFKLTEQGDIVEATVSSADVDNIKQQLNDFIEEDTGIITLPDNFGYDGLYGSVTSNYTNTTTQNRILGNFLVYAEFAGECDFITYYPNINSGKFNVASYQVIPDWSEIYLGGTNIGYRDIRSLNGGTIFRRTDDTDLNAVNPSYRLTLTRTTSSVPFDPVFINGFRCFKDYNSCYSWNNRNAKEDEYYIASSFYDTVEEIKISQDQLKIDWEKANKDLYESIKDAISDGMSSADVQTVIDNKYGEQLDEINKQLEYLNKSEEERSYALLSQFSELWKRFDNIDELLDLNNELLYSIDEHMSQLLDMDFGTSNSFSTTNIETNTDVITNINDSFDNELTNGEGWSEVADVFKTKFPFCVPWDILYVFNSLATEPETPSWIWNWYIPLPNSEDYIVSVDLDLARFDPLAKTLRTLLSLLFIFFLIKMTQNMFKDEVL